MPNSDEAFERHNPKLTEAMLQVDRKYAGAEPVDPRPSRDSILYNDPYQTGSVVNDIGARLDDLNYRRDILVEERERIERLFMDVVQAIDLCKSLLNASAAPKNTLDSPALRGVGSKAY